MDNSLFFKKMSQPPNKFWLGIYRVPTTCQALVKNAGNLAVNKPNPCTHAIKMWTKRYMLGREKNETKQKGGDEYQDQGVETLDKVAKEVLTGW